MSPIINARAWIDRATLYEHPFDRIDWCKFSLLSDLMQHLYDRAVQMAPQFVGTVFGKGGISFFA